MIKKMFTPWMLIGLFVFSSVCFVGCGTNNNPDEVTNKDAISEDGSMTNENMDATATNQSENNTQNPGETILDGAENLVDDVVDDLTDVDFTDYNSSQDYLLQKIGGEQGNKNNRYVVKEANKEPVNYLPEDTSRKGFRYHVYDTTSDTEDKYGIFYVDSETGKIYREDSKTKKVEEYKGY